MFTRSQYMAGECSHHEYYRQFVTQDIIDAVKNTIGQQRVLNAYSSGDEHLNSIPLIEWDSLGYHTRSAKAEHLRVLCGEGGWSLAFNCCVLKAAARMLIFAEDLNFYTRDPEPETIPPLEDKERSRIEQLLGSKYISEPQFDICVRALLREIERLEALVDTEKQ